MHYGQLKAYGEGAQHVLIKVNKPGLSVHLMAFQGYRQWPVNNKNCSQGCFSQKGKFLFSLVVVTIK